MVISWALGLKDKSSTAVAKHSDEFLRLDSHNFYPFTTKLLSLLENEYDTVVITNEPQFVAESVMKLFPFTKCISTIFQTQNNIFTGEVSRFNSTKADKKTSVHEIFADYTRDQSLAFGDSIGDIGMFEEVEFPICVNASEDLKDTALERKWTVTNPDNIIDVVSKIL